MVYTKPITGSWFEFLHHNTAEGKYWNETITAFTEEQWRLKLREMFAKSIETASMQMIQADVTYPVI